MSDQPTLSAFGSSSSSAISDLRDLVRQAKKSRKLEDYWRVGKAAKDYLAQAAYKGNRPAAWLVEQLDTERSQARKAVFGETTVRHQIKFAERISLQQVGKLDGIRLTWGATMELIDCSDGVRDNLIRAVLANPELRERSKLRDYRRANGDKTDSVRTPADLREAYAKAAKESERLTKVLDGFKARLDEVNTQGSALQKSSREHKRLERGLRATRDAITRTLRLLS